MIKLKDLPVALIGDTHCIDYRFHRVLEGLSDISLIHLGDAGWGFDNWKEETKNVETILEICERNNIDLFFIRGNHCSPRYFDQTSKQGNITWLKDYSILQISDGRKIQICGGAHSIDRQNRVPGRDWWDGEAVISRIDLAESVDILLTHTSFGRLFGFPTDKGPPLSWSKNDPLLLKDLKEEQDLIYQIFLKCGPKKHFCGHFHKSVRAEHMGCEIRVLDIFELLEIK